MYTYRYIVRTFSDQRWKRFDRSFSCALQFSLKGRYSDLSLKKVHVDTRLDFDEKNTATTW